jgi:hypothetical protein
VSSALLLNGKRFTLIAVMSLIDFTDPDLTHHIKAGRS